MNLSLFSRQPNYLLFRSVILVRAVGFFKPCIYWRLLVNLSLFSRQPNYRFSRSVTLVKAVGLFKPCFY